MNRKGWVCCGIGLALAFVTLACGQPAEPGEPAVAPTQEDDRPPPPPPGPNEVRITVVCPAPAANGRVPFRVIIHPPFREVIYGADVTWSRVKQGQGNNYDEFTLDVETEEQRDAWPWTGKDGNGVDLGRLPWTSDTLISGTHKEIQETDPKKYSITLRCNGDTTIIDPRMRVVPQL